eukprot:3713755-Lingulodinium_polyedra.AAC.1
MECENWDIVVFDGLRARVTLGTYRTRSRHPCATLSRRPPICYPWALTSPPGPGTISPCSPRRTPRSHTATSLTSGTRHLS